VRSCTVKSDLQSDAYVRVVGLLDDLGQKRGLRQTQCRLSCDNQVALYSLDAKNTTPNLKAKDNRLDLDKFGRVGGGGRGDSATLQQYLTCSTNSNEAHFGTHKGERLVRQSFKGVANQNQTFRCQEGSWKDWLDVYL
jgi:hypothetical protein